VPLKTGTSNWTKEQSMQKHRIINLNTYSLHFWNYINFEWIRIIMRLLLSVCIKMAKLNREEIWRVRETTDIIVDSNCSRFLIDASYFVHSMFWKRKICKVEIKVKIWKVCVFLCWKFKRSSERSSGNRQDGSQRNTASLVPTKCRKMIQWMIQKMIQWMIQKMIN